ncbi:MAG: hydroxyacylglutathione hydrolase [Pseudomonadota bacterium]
MLSIEAIPIFSDNYVWLISCSQTAHAFVVDPGDADPIEQTLTDRSLALKGVLITHWHHDHIGGLEQLQASHKGQLSIYGPDTSRIPRVNHPVAQGAQLNVLGAKFDVMEVPGHTLDHIAFFSAELNALFCGDALFAGGCGRMFEGTAEVMHQSLSALSALPGDTHVFCAHEYTQANLAFAREVEPDNDDLMERIRQTDVLRAAQKMTVPSTIAIEQKTNPFLRTQSPSIISTLERKGLDHQPDWKAFASLRIWKDTF